MIKINRVGLLPDEAAWVSRNVLKLIRECERQGEKDPKLLERASYKVLKATQGEMEYLRDVVAAFTEEECYEVDLFISKKQKEFVKGLAGQLHRGLVDAVIPNYEKRGAGYETYLERAKDKAVLLEAIWRKFK